MRHVVRLFSSGPATIALVVFAFLACPALSAQERPEAAAPQGYVLVLPIQGVIDKPLMYILRRALRDIRTNPPEALILDIDTPGGRLLETEEIIQILRSFDFPVYAYVNPHALSAGAIISLATDGIYMAPGSRIGSAMPIMITPLGGGVAELPEGYEEKILSDTRALVRGLAQENGYREDVATAMVDRSKELRIGERLLCPEGDLLNLTADEAVEIIPPDTEPVLASGKVTSIDELLEAVGLSGLRIERISEEPAETLARYITLIGPLLLALGLLGVYIEIRTPGIGVPGIGGAILLMIYFFGHYVAGLAGNEEIFLVVVGLVLIAIEVFLIPGFGVAGIVGLLCLVAGIGLGLVPATPPSTLPPLPDWDPSYFQEYVARAVYQLAGAVALLIAGIYVLGRVLPKTAAYHGLVLSQALSAGDGYVSSDRHSRYDRYLGKQAIALTTLRPAGTVTLEDDDRIDVVTEGDMVPKGTRVVITEIRGTRVVVRPVADSDA